MMSQRFLQQNLILLPQHQIEIVLQSKLGSGAQGSVYQGFIKNSNQQVAIKVMNELNPREEQILQSLKKEKPKHIITIYAVEKISNQVYIVMELAERDFFQYMNTDQFKTYDVDEKSELFLQMGQGVQEFHQLGYFHRDLKPENFVCCRDKNQKLIIKLIDFGCSKNQQNIGRQTLQVGTPYYMAKDVINSPSYTKEADIWAMGTIWYEMLKLETFFKGISQCQIFERISTITKDQIDQQIDKLDECQVEFKEIMKEMICIDVQKRISLEKAIEKITQALEQIKYQKIEAKTKIKIEKEFQEKERQMTQFNQIKYEQLLKQMKLDNENQIAQLKYDLKYQYEQQIVNKENELKKIFQQQQQASNQNQQNNKLQQELQYQSQLNQYKNDTEQKFQQQLKQEIQLLENMQKDSLLILKQKVDEENKKQLSEEFQKYYQQELNKKQLEYQKQIQNQYKKEELNSKKQQLKYIINLLKDTIQNHLVSINQQNQEIEGFLFNNQEKQNIFNQIKNFINQKQNELIKISKDLSNFDTQDQYQQFKFLVDLETSYKNQFQIHIQEYQIIQQEIQSLMISSFKEQQKEVLLQKQEQEEQEIQKEISDQVAKYKELTNKFNKQLSQIKNIQLISENFSIYNHNINNQFIELKYNSDSVAQSVNQLRIFYESQENNVSKDLIQYLQIQLQEINKSLEKLEQDIQLMQNSLSDQEVELKQEIQTYLQKLEEKSEEIDLKIKNYKKVNDEQQDNIQTLLQERLQNIKQLFNQLNTLIQSEIPQQIKQFIEIKQKYLEEVQNIKDLSYKLQEQQQRQIQINIMTKNYLDFIFHIQQISNQFQESIQDLKNQLSPIQQNCSKLENQSIQYLLEEKQIELNKYKEKAKERFDEIQSKTKQDILDQQTLESLKEESISIQIVLENQTNQYRNQIIELNNLSQQILKQCQSETDLKYQKIKDELQFLIQDFNQKQIEFMNFDVQNYNYEQIIEQHKLKEEEFQKLVEKMKSTYEKYKQNLQLIKEGFKKTDQRCSDNVQNFNQKFKEIQIKNKEKSKNLANKIGEIDLLSKKVKFCNQLQENNTLQNWKRINQSRVELNKKLIEFRGKIQGMQKSNYQDTLEQEFEDLKNQVDSLSKQIPSQIEMRKFQKQFNDNEQSLLILSLLIIMIKAYNLKRYSIRLQEFQEQQNQQIKEPKSHFRQNLTKTIEVNEIMQKYESLLRCKYILVIKEELTEDEQKLDKQNSEVLNYIKTKNRVKLRSALINQQLIQDVTDNFFENLEFCQLEVWKKVKQQNKKP